MPRKAIKRAIASALCLLPLVSCQVGNSSVFPPELNALRTISVGFVVFPGFEPLDVFGPLEILGAISFFYKISLSIIAAEPGLVPAGSPPWGGPGVPKTDFGYVITPSIQATHSFENAPPLDVLYVPGGLGVVSLEQNNDTSVEDFINLRYPKAEYLVGVSFGVVSLAKSGVLNGKKATTNKSGWQWITTGHGNNITWVPQARWVEDGNIWTTSGIASGLDATYALFKRIYGTQALNYMLNVMEYAPHLDPAWDPYAAVFNVSGSDQNATRVDCVAPVPLSL